MSSDTRSMGPSAVIATTRVQFGGPVHAERAKFTATAIQVPVTMPTAQPRRSAHSSNHRV